MIALPVRRAAVFALTLMPGFASGQSNSPRALMPIDLTKSAEARWLAKEVLDSRLLDNMKTPSNWIFQGTGKITFLALTDRKDFPALRVDMDMFTDKPAPTRNGLSSINLRRPFANEDWSKYNRLSFWVRPHVSGFPMLPLQIVLHNDGEVKVPDLYGREGIHYITLENEKWQHIVWEITPLARDKVTMIEIGYWVNKMLTQPSDRVAFEMAMLELQRVEPDNYEGWAVGPHSISYSNSGYRPGSRKIAIASNASGSDLTLYRNNEKVPAPIKRVSNRLGNFQVLDFSGIRKPGTYLLKTGSTRSVPFEIGEDAWKSSIWKTINFFYGERCGYAVPGSHGVDHQDWFATHGDQKIVMNGGWHDAGDLSQGMVNTGEATYAMFALAETLKNRGDDPALLARLLEEAKWGLDWVMKVRFDGGYRIGFASHNLWTNNVAGDADDRSREAKNNPNVNYIAAAAGAIGYRMLRDAEPDLARKALVIAEDDWNSAIAGKEGPDTWSTPAFAATPIELAGIGILASLELYKATARQQYADKAFELAPIILASQQKSYIGTTFPLSGFFYTGPDKDTLFHEFHRGNDQAPIVALAKLAEMFPNHNDWMKWYSTVALYSEYQKTSARTTAPYEVLPAYVYSDKEYLQVPEKGALHMATREAFRAQVLQGMPMGDGYYLKTFPVWFARRGNYGVLLSQSKALSAAGRLRRDASALDLAERQAQWVVGLNPFAQSTMYGEGSNWAQQYSVSSGDFAGSLPVGMQSKGLSDLPYWPSQNMYVYKEVWVHPSARWLWLMQDLEEVSPMEGKRDRTFDFALTATTADDGAVTINLTAKGSGAHTFDVRSENLADALPGHSLNLRSNETRHLEWRSRMTSMSAPWVVVVVADKDPSLRRDIVGASNRFSARIPVH